MRVSAIVLDCIWEAKVSAFLIARSALLLNHTSLILGCVPNRVWPANTAVSPLSSPLQTFCSRNLPAKVPARRKERPLYLQAKSGLKILHTTK